MKAFQFCGAALLLASCASHQNSPVDYADPMVGTGFHGHTYPGATTPFGAVQLSPDTRAGNWDACSGYHYSDNTIDGFSHTHLSGTGCCDLGDVFFRPTTAEINIDADTLYRPASFSHKDETARPGYYRVKLSDEGILAELTATTHTGVHRYTFPEGKPAQIIIDLDHTLSGEDVYDTSMRQTSDNEISGTRITDGWVADHHVHFTTRFSQPIEKCEIIHDGHTAVLTFENTGAPIVAAVALSGVSEENSKQNLEAEVAQLDFDIIADNANREWDDALSVITVEGGTQDQLKNFYSALYHAMITPNQMSDVNGQFRRNNDEIGTTADGRRYYNTFSIWDTFRAWHPLMTIINPELVCDMVNSMLDMYDSTGELPVWSLASGETGCMIGYHAVSVITDAYMKGLDCFDAEKALTAMVNSTGTPRKGADIYAETGYIPSNSKSESVSCTIEYSYDDWCIARMAEKLGNDSIAKKYYQRALNYNNVFDGSTRFFRGRKSDGNWQRPFNPNAVSRDLTEATPWQYRFGAMHDVNGMIDMFGGNDSFLAALDSIFVAPEMVGDLSDITGLIGQYSHGNEPSHHIAYLYNYVGKPWKTQEWTRRLLDEMYQPTPEGLCGNEDCGQMSAWYIMTALGLYPVTPGSNEFAITTPLFEKATIKLPNDTTLTILANNPAKNKYIEKVSLNGKEINSNFIDYSDVMAGGELVFTLTDKPVTTRGTEETSAPYSLTQKPRVAMPYIEQDVYLFSDNIDVEIGCNTPDAKIYYTLDGTTPTEQSNLYSEPISIDKSCVINAIGMREGYQSSPVLTVEATKAEFLPSLNAKADKNGVAYSYFEGNFEKTADLAKAIAKEKGTMPRPSIEGAKTDDHFGYIFEGLINVPKDGVYTFRTTTDDGSRLLIDSQLVVNNDGGHSAISATGDVALKAGLHSFKFLYFEDYEGESLDWDWRLPGDSDFTSIPDASLFLNN